ncbi:SET domain containing (Lysine methyltransferase) 8 [Cichlidogyrus casuarinus]|uniref:SET domain containing (Lysine methyltransferase) 8 n=1 Tax=Cichlidogyrus casuarinus TaxID=1844966 RepID=A0ABD2QGC1_9PLAT
MAVLTLQIDQEQNIIDGIRNGVEKNMKIVQILEKGRGVIATQHFIEGDFVVEYAGELVSDKEAKDREEKYKKDPSIGSYMFFFNLAGKKYCVDATAESGKLGRLLNHSRLKPNCYIKALSIDNGPRLAIIAKRFISPGEELLYDYGDRDKETLLAHPWLNE